MGPQETDSAHGGAVGGGQDGLVRVLTDTLRDPHAKLRRRTMAALGELLFYIATQDEDPPADPQQPPPQQWYMAGATVAAVARCLQEGEDEVVCHYAAKTIENILAQSTATHCRRFATQEVALRLLDLTTHRRSEALQTTAVAALGHLLRYALVKDPGVADQVQLSPGAPGVESGLSAGGGARLIARLFDRTSGSGAIAQVRTGPRLPILQVTPHRALRPDHRPHATRYTPRLRTLHHLAIPSPRHPTPPLRSTP